jgi:putative nucleotidyltransferase with HDIG domain
MKPTNVNKESISLPETLLIVDDEAGIRKLLHRKLAREGYECQEANSAEQALEILSATAIGLVILDVKLPGKSGVEVLPEIKMGYPDTAIIMGTVLSEMNVAVQCLKQGADDYICKPFDLDEVSLGVQKALERRALQLQLKEYQRHLEEKVEEQTREIRKLFLGAIESLVFALEAKDRYTGGHSRRVAEMALATGDELGLSTDEMEDVRWGSLLHDIGKIAVDQRVHSKAGRLTDEEYEHIMIHARVGARIVEPVVNDRVVEMIEHHHDHYDGSGFNQTMQGREIPLAARIIAVADAYDAMTSDRPYRPAMSMREAAKEIKRCSGTQFDPVVVSAFLRTVTVGVRLTENRNFLENVNDGCPREYGDSDGGAGNE